MALAGTSLREPVSPRLEGKRVPFQTPEVDLDIASFHAELRQRNLRNLFWTACIFNPVYLTWSIFDYVLLPTHWAHFLALRLGVVTVVTLVAISVHKFGLARYTWEAWVIVCLAYVNGVAPMLPLSGEYLPGYVLGFAVTFFATGLVPMWPPRWTMSVLLVSLGFSVAIFAAGWTGDVAVRDVVQSAFFVLTSAVISVYAAYFKYDLARRDYSSRAQLSAVAQRESEARLDLAQTSIDLQRALEDLKGFDRLKSKFFANVSHELRTPLTLILAPLAELTEDIENPSHRQQVHVIRRNAERLLGLINDLLDLSRLDAGGLRLNLAEMDVRTVAASVHENSLPAAMAKSIDFTLISDAPGAKIWGDAHRLEIVFTNLVSNAIKFTPAGGKISIRIADVDGGVCVEVEDSGPGIPPEDLPKVFERFFQVSPGDRRREGGVGIGLALAKELVELHGGTIEVASEPEVFTRFRVVLPFGREHIRPEVVERRQQFDREAAQGRRAEDLLPLDVEEGGGEIERNFEELRGVVDPPVLFDGLRRARILLVEDHEEVREFIRTLLRPHYELLLAENGREAWELVRAESPDLVVSDVMMPEMSGTDLARAIKSDPALRATPVILLTARVGSEATLEAYAHGADDFVAKPFHPRVLMARIRAQLRLRALGLQLAQQEKLAAVGTLAAGILHEVRNPVNAILNAARVLSGGRSKPEMTRQLIQVIADGAQRIEGITTALDSHARPAEAGVTHSCDIREGLDATLTLLAHRLEGVTVHREYETDRLARAPAGPINQVLLNLIDNAIRAGAATLWLHVEEDGDTLQVKVCDDGTGIATEDAERIFNPFYTRRKDGTGTGLGLYLSRQIMEEHGGELRPLRQTGRGACFVVEIPAVGRRRPRESEPTSEFV